MFKKIYSKFVDFSVAKPWWVIAGGLLITLFFTWQMSTLKISMTWMDMLPQQEPMVQGYYQLTKTFGNTDMIFGVVETESEAETIALVEKTAEKLREQDQWVERIDVTVDTAFIRQHGLMLMKKKDLNRFKRILADPNLLPWLTAMNDDFEREYIEDSGNLKKEETQAASQIHALGYLVDSLANMNQPQTPSAIGKAVDKLTVGDQYMLSTDRKMAIFIIQPTFTTNDIDKVFVGVKAIQAQVDQLEAEHPGSWIALTGMPVLAKDETKSAQEDSMMITLGALLLITALFIISFRMWTAPLLAMMILVVGILWDYGLAKLLIGKLTMFSSMSALLLLGLGVDYLMHFLNGFFEARVAGKNAHDSILEVYRTSGKGIVLGGLTTSLVFFSMMLTNFPALSEFGITMGLGIITCMAVTLLLLPAIMVLRERHMLKKAAKGKMVKPFAVEFKVLNKVAACGYKRPFTTLVITIVLTGFMAWGASMMWFDKNYLNAEEEGLESVELYDVMEDRFDMNADAMIFTTASIEAAETKAKALDEIVTVGSVESIASYLPSEKSQQERKPLIAEIRKIVRGHQLSKRVDQSALVREIERLSDNIVEMSQMGYLSGLSKITKQCDRITGLDQEGNQKVPNRIRLAADTIKQQSDTVLGIANKAFYSQMQKNVDQMANTATIQLKDIRPDIRKRLVSPDGKTFLVQAFSRQNVYKNIFKTSFIKDVHTVAPQATGMPGIFRRLIVLSGEKGLFALKIAAVLIILMLLMTFRSVKYTALALTPVVLAYLFTFGTLGFLNLPLTMVNVMMLPLILGIGIDDGIHLVHRYRIEGPGSQAKIVSSTGKAILLTSITTILGFGSLITAKYQGFGQMAYLTAIGIAWCFIISVILIPTILSAVERRKK